MTWNYRLMAHQEANETYITMHEVYYDNNENPISCTENGVCVCSETISGIKWVLEQMGKAINKPVLYYGDRFPEEYKPEE